MIRALDLFCGAGGASMGLHRAGFDVTGVDIRPQKNYPFKFSQADAMTFPLGGGWDFIWASPPCQRYSTLAKRHPRNVYPDLIAPIRERLILTGADYVIENVIGAPLNNPMMLCGSMFGLRVRRHRIFESSFKLIGIGDCNHLAQGRPVDVSGTGANRLGNRKDGGGGNPNKPKNLADARDAMGINWMTRPELSQSIPPAYSEYIARQFIQHKKNNLQPIGAMP